MANGGTVFLDEVGEPAGEVAHFLSHRLKERMRKRPRLRLRFAVPISQDGDTVELHAWHGQVLFPGTSPMANPETSGAED